MKYYYIKPNKDWKKKQWFVTESGFSFGKKTFTDRQSAIEYAKKAGRQHRESRIVIENGAGNKPTTWPYQKLPPQKKYGKDRK